MTLRTKVLIILLLGYLLPVLLFLSLLLMGSKAGIVQEETFATAAFAAAPLVIALAVVSFVAVDRLFLRRIRCLRMAAASEAAIGGAKTGSGKDDLAALEKEVGHLLDVLRRTRAELDQSRSNEARHERMASIGVLAAGVAHEINNPLGFIKCNLGTLQQYLGIVGEYISLNREFVAGVGDPMLVARTEGARQAMEIDYIMNDGRQLIEESLDGADRVRRIIQDLKTLSRVDGGEAVWADINECLMSALNLVWNEVKYKAVVHRDFGSLPLVRCVPSRFNQVFTNLFMNAAQAIKTRGEISVRTWSDGADVFVLISDNGCGIHPEHLNHIFDPFFTTKKGGEGTGLGLSVSYDIIRKHGGEIVVSSEVGRGTTFNIRIPVEEEGEGEEKAEAV